MSRCICAEINARNCPVHQHNEKTMTEIRDAEAERIANQYAQPFIRSMYPRLSRGEMARKFKEVFSFGFEYREKLDDEALKDMTESRNAYAMALKVALKNSIFPDKKYVKDEIDKILTPKIRELRGEK